MGAAFRPLYLQLRTAINYHRREGLCSEVVSVVLPEKPLARERWLTRAEAARLLWAAWRAKQVMRDKDTRRAVGRHVARFILVGSYTGSRSSAICGAALMPTVGRGHVDLDILPATESKTHGRDQPREYVAFQKTKKAA